MPKKSPGPRSSRSLLGDDEAVGRVGQRLEPLAALVGQRILIQQDAERLVRTAADAAAQLVQLRQAEPLGVLDQHDRGVRDVDADFDHRRRDQDVELAAREGLHHAVLRVLLHPPVQQRDAQVREDVLREMVRHLGRGACRSTFSDSSTSG